MNYWNDGTCMSRLNAKYPDKRCTREVCENSDFCRYHKRYGKYLPSLLCEKRDKLKKLVRLPPKNSAKIKNSYRRLYDMLNKDHLHSLLYIYDSWDEIPIENIIKIDNEYWEITLLLKSITQQLNSCDMGNAHPKYPYNPFNRNPFSVKDLRYLKSKLTDDIQRDMIIDIFLSYKDLKFLYGKAKGFYYETTSTMREYFSIFMRFKIINYKDSQDNYVGYWVDKKVPKSHFEMLHDKYKDTSPLMIVGDTIVSNPDMEILNVLMDAEPEENF